MDLSKIFFKLAFFLLYQHFRLAFPLEKVTLYPMKNVAECLARPCPDPLSSQWEYVQEYCCPHGGAFHCQADKKGQDIRRICMEPKICPAGQYADLSLVADSTLLSSSICLPCPLNEFQPHSTPSHHFTRSGCHNIGRDCIRMNALVVEIGKPIHDDKCICNAIKGYRPVPLKDDNCLEFFSASRCQCQHMPCPDGKVLSPRDFRCKEASLSIVKEYLDLRELILKHVQHNLAMEEELRDRSFDIAENTFYHVVSFLISASIIYQIAFALSFLILLWIVIVGRRRMIRRKDRTHSQDFAVHVCLNSKKECFSVLAEIKNILPLLERMYGRLAVSYSLHSKIISVIVDANCSQRPFSILRFVQDLRTNSIVRRSRRNSIGLNSDVKIVIIPEPSTNRKGIEDFLTMVRRERLPNNSGILTIRCARAEVENNILSSLVSSEMRVKESFTLHALQLTDIRRGSIELRFHLVNGSETFDALAVDRRFKSIATDLFSNETFRDIASNQGLSMEFVCKTRLPSTSVVLADSLIMQIGKENIVCLGEHVHNRVGPDELFVATDTGHQEMRAEMLKINVIRVSPGTTQPDVLTDTGTSHGFDATKNNEIHITVTCADKAVAKLLNCLWTDLMPLLRRLHPGCTMKVLNTTTLSWTLSNHSASIPDVETFVADLISTRKIQDATRQSPLQVEVQIPFTLKTLIPSLPWERDLVSRRKRFTKAVKSFCMCALCALWDCLKCSLSCIVKVVLICAFIYALLLVYISYFPIKELTPRDIMNITKQLLAFK